MRRLFARARALRERGVLGINQRNGAFVLPLNPRKHYPRVDDKLITKRLAEAAGIPTPGLLGVIAYQHQLRDLPRLLEGRDQFVLKPAHGAQGNGIVVVTQVEADGRFRKSSGTLLTPLALRQHVSNTISGVFSLRGDADTCLIEARVILHPALHDLTRFGIPDIRVVVYRGVPVMAMCRLPTAESDGRANLHQGAIGAGIAIRDGRATHAAIHNQSVTHHVDTQAPIVGFQVPQWDEVLSLATRAAEMSGLGYLGVDVVVDAAHGPLLLELNARPGLAIQIANNQGLLPRLRRAETLPAAALATWQDRMAAARDIF
ncbi:MAG: alpha-L-glutamate ligase-like protein [Deltaproteobacteria bacterium]|nr:alpha-L-glutamate ligase-like protein [Deltaproteobacteria bacterium]